MWVIGKIYPLPKDFTTESDVVVSFGIAYA